MARKILVKPSEGEVVDLLCTTILEKSKECLKTSETFNVGLSGGSLAKFLCQGLPKLDADFTKWRFFFCDERLVPEDSSDSTWGLYKSQLLKAVPLKEEQFLKVKTDLTPENAAKDYQDQIEKTFGSPPSFHLLLLGAGPDGHTCSLFPGHPLMDEPAPPAGRIVAHITDSPKPPPARVTLTLPAVKSAGSCIFAATGAGKAEMMKKLLGNEDSTPPLPARLVIPDKGEVLWILDSAAAEKLNL